MKYKGKFKKKEKQEKRWVYFILIPPKKITNESQAAKGFPIVSNDCEAVGSLVVIMDETWGTCDKSTRSGILCCPWALWHIFTPWSHSDWAIAAQSHIHTWSGVTVKHGTATEALHFMELMPACKESQSSYLVTSSSMPNFTQWLK